MSYAILYLIALLSSLGFADQSTQPDSPDTLSVQMVREGDILFQNLDCGALCDAIEGVTEGAGGRDFSHCGLVVKRGEEWGVIEAYGSVRFTPLSRFLERTKAGGPQGMVIGGRVKREDHPLAVKTPKIAADFLGYPYDTLFAIGNEAFYCSELIYEVYRQANGGRPFFLLEPMTYATAGDSALMDTWVDYFKSMDCLPPEGEPGINPGGLSRSPKLELFMPSIP